MTRTILAEDVQEAWDIFADAITSLGFPRALYGFIGGWRGPADAVDATILHRGPPGYVDIYLDEQLYVGNPLFAWCQRNSGFMRADALIAKHSGPVTPQLRRLMEMRQEFRHRSGYVGSLKGVIPGVLGALTINPHVSVTDEELEALWAANGDTIQTLAMAMHLRICTLPKPFRRPLSSRQRDVLEWASQGKTVRDISTIMGLSPPTVEKHLRLARDALEATNTAQAVRKALELCLLDGAA